MGLVFSAGVVAIVGGAILLAKGRGVAGLVSVCLGATLIAQSLIYTTDLHLP